MAVITEEEIEAVQDMEPDPLVSWPYENRCWNCGKPISSETCKRDPIPENGYICNYCGKSLRELTESRPKK